MKNVLHQHLKTRINIWDLAAFLLVMGLIALLAWGSRQMIVPYTPGQQLELSLAPAHLPVYALRSVLRLLLPGIFPALLTGLVTASGGTWNASIVAEVVSWGDTRLMATGLGSYIAQWSEKADYPHIVLGIAVMSLYVVALNRFVWRRLYSISQTRFRLD